MYQKMAQLSNSEKRGPLVLQTLYAPVQGNARAKKWEWVGRGVAERTKAIMAGKEIQLYTYNRNSTTHPLPLLGPGIPLYWGI